MAYFWAAHMYVRPKKGKTPKRIANGRLPCSGDTSGEIDVMWELNCALMCMGINLCVLYASHGKRENMPHGFTRSLGMVAKSRKSYPRPLGHLAPCQEKQTGSYGAAVKCLGTWLHPHGLGP